MLDLNDIPLLRNLPKKQLDKLKELVREKSFKKGDILSYEGNMCGRILLVRSGRIKISRTALNGREQILEVLGPGNTCACNTGESIWQCSSSAQAMTNCSVWILPRKYFAQFVDSNSQLSRALNQHFAERLRKLSSLIHDVALDAPQSRLAKFLVNMHNSNESAKHEDGTVYLKFTHEEISQRLGLVRETITRHLQQLKRRKLIDIKARRIVILDEPGLKKLFQT